MTNTENRLENQEANAAEQASVSHTALTAPKRIQRKRTKGWKMPPNTVCVTRPGRFGNPIPVGVYFLGGDPGGIGGPFHMSWCITDANHADSRYTLIDTRLKAVDAFRTIARSRFTNDELAQLRGKNLACWCPLVDQHDNYVPCHADVLLELANADGQSAADIERQLRAGNAAAKAAFQQLSSKDGSKG